MDLLRRTAHGPLPVFDVIIVGGGIAGSTLAGVLARSGLGVLVLEKEVRFRDRIRGEGTWPYGVADAFHLGLKDLLTDAGAVELSAFQRYASRQITDVYQWATDPIDGAPKLGFSYPTCRKRRLPGQLCKEPLFCARPKRRGSFSMERPW